MNYSKLKWNLYRAKRDRIYRYASKNQKLFTYSTKVLERLRKYSYCGVPLSILLLDQDLLNSHCYTAAILGSFSLESDNFVLVEAEIDSIKLNPRNHDIDCEGDEEAYYGHWFIEYTDSLGDVYVFDTTAGLIMPKSLYYMCERPKVLNKITPDELKDNQIYRRIIDGEKENDDIIMLFIMSDIMERVHQIDDEAGPIDKKLKNEIKEFLSTHDIDSIYTKYNSMENKPILCIPNIFKDIFDKTEYTCMKTNI